MRDERKVLLLPYVFLVFFVVIFLLPFVSFAEYSIISNTTSHLGAQKAPFNWVMNLVFVALGGLVIFDSNLVFRNFYFQRVCLIVFGIGLIGSGLFPHRSLVGETNNITLDYWHSLFATLTGIGFAFFAFSVIFIVSQKWLKWSAIAVFIVSILVPILMVHFEGFQGLLQRFMMITALLWLMLLEEYFRKEFLN